MAVTIRTACTVVHCEACGREDPVTDEGYTACCNELVCQGDWEQRWVIGVYKDGNDDMGTPTGKLDACCGHVADLKAAALSVEPKLVVLYRDF